ncbi:MAG: hypothetical protein ACFFCS_04445 [Candidatus Hodarchaeota archaeon]
MTTLEEKPKIAVWKRFRDNRKFLEITGGMLFFACFGAIIYLASVGRTITTHLAIDPLIILAPVFFLEIFILGDAVVRFLLFPKEYIVKNPKSVRIIRVLQIIVLALDITMIIYLVSLLNSGFFTGATVEQYQNFSLVFNGLSIGILFCSYIDTFACVELKNNKLAKKIKAKYSENKIGVKKILPRIFEYCGKHYFQLILIFLLFQFIYALLYTFLLEPAMYALVNLFVTANPEDPNLAALFYGFFFFNYFILTLKNAFFYFSMAIGIHLTVNSYRGSDAKFSDLFTFLKKKGLGLFFLSFLFSFLETFISLLDAMIFRIPGVIFGLFFYVYCIMALPNFIVERKYRFLENFGKSKDLLKKNTIRSALYVGLLLKFPYASIKYYLINLLGIVANIFIQSFPIQEIKTDWQLQSSLGLFINVNSEILGLLIAPFEVALISILFIDLSRRKELKIIDAGGDTTAKGKIEKAKQLPFEERLSLAYYCPNCGLSVKKGLKRCPNCKQTLERG